MKWVGYKWSAEDHSIGEPQWPQRVLWLFAKKHAFTRLPGDTAQVMKKEGLGGFPRIRNEKIRWDNTREQLGDLLQKGRKK